VQCAQNTFDVGERIRNILGLRNIRELVFKVSCHIEKVGDVARTNRAILSTVGESCHQETLSETHHFFENSTLIKVCCLGFVGPLVVYLPLFETLSEIHEGSWLGRLCELSSFDWVKY